LIPVKSCGRLASLEIFTVILGFYKKGVPNLHNKRQNYADVLTLGETVEHRARVCKK
jgi:hypothetical protein